MQCRAEYCIQHLIPDYVHFFNELVDLLTLFDRELFGEIVQPSALAAKGELDFPETLGFPERIAPGLYKRVPCIQNRSPIIVNIGIKTVHIVCANGIAYKLKDEIRDFDFTARPPNGICRLAQPCTLPLQCLNSFTGGRLGSKDSSSCKRHHQNYGTRNGLHNATSNDIFAMHRPNCFHQSRPRSYRTI